MKAVETPRKSDSSKTFIASVATATPPFSVTQAEADAILTKHYSDRLSPRFLSVMHAIFSHPSIARRHFAITDPESLITEDADSRIARFTDRAVGLSAEAVIKALKQAGKTGDAVSAIVVNTCTGYICPGISTYLIEKLDLPRDVRVYDLVGSGCGGAVPNLEVAASLLPQDDRVVVSVSVEICSATFEMENDLSAVISNALFADGAAAAILWRRPEGLELIDSASLYFPEHREQIRYVHKGGRLHNQLSTSLPQLVKKAAAGVAGELLKRHGLSIQDVGHWAIHPGGDKIINSVGNELGLSESRLRPTRDILSRYGNMSSPTVLYVLREILDSGMQGGDWCLMLAFGAGMSAHACLLRNK